MADDTLERVLRLVAEGRLSADEAAPILAALDDAPVAGSAPGATGSAPRATGSAPGAREPGGEGSAASSATGGSRAAGPGGATSLRIEVTEHGRRVLNLRLPIGVGRFALDRIPGLSGDQVDRVRDALSNGLRGPVLEVDDDDDKVRIVLE
jgi:hypothetical protein